MASIVAVTAAAGVGAAAIAAAARRLTGEIQQVPPGISAIKVGGQRAYKLTREGAAPRLAARTVTVSALDDPGRPPAGDLLDVDVEVTCSSGTYIRAIARDLGAALAVGGHLTALRRTRVGPYRIERRRTLDELAGSLEIIGWPRRPRRRSRAGICPRGRPAWSPTAPYCPRRAPPPAGPVAAFGPDGTLIALLTERDGQARSLAVFVP